MEPLEIVQKNQFNKSQGCHNLSKTEGAVQKLGGQNIKNDLTFHVFEMKFQGK